MMGINGRSFAMDRIDVTAKLGTAEIWEISARRHADGPSVPRPRSELQDPEQERQEAEPQHESGWKDVVLVEEHAEILVRFDNPAPPKMPFMYHCHILEHEDHGMMGQFAVV